MKTAKFLIVACFGILTTCSRTTFEHDVDQEPFVAVFCILNPDTKVQKLLIQNTFSGSPLENAPLKTGAAQYDEIMLINEHLEINATALSHVATNLPDSIHYDTDYLFGSGLFNYVFAAQVEYGSTYQLEVTTPDQATLSSTARIPGPFHVIEVTDIDVEGWPPDINKKFEIAWTPSENAAGYLVDLTVLKYDVSSLFTKETEINHELANYLYTIHSDTSKIVHLPFYEIQIDSDQKTDGVQRGFLTQNTNFGISYETILKQIDYPYHKYNSDYSGDELLTISKNIFRIRATICAVNDALYDFAAFQYLTINKKGAVGQQTIIPDISNIKGGLGIFGAAISHTVHSRLLGYYSHFHDDTRQFGSNSQWDDHVAPHFITDNTMRAIDVEDTLTLRWTPVDSADFYIFIAKPYYLWFMPPNHVIYTKNPKVNLNLGDFPIKNCEIECYVKALRFNSIDTLKDRIFHDQDVFEFIDGEKRNWLKTDYYLSNFILSAHEKAPLLLNGMYMYFFDLSPFAYNVSFKDLKYYYASLSLPRPSTPWSESIFIHTADGDWPGFEQLQPRAAANNIQWQPVQGADAYLVYAKNESGAWAAAVTRETNIAPPFETPIESIEGAHTLPVAAGEKLTWRVQALRLKTGGLGFAIEKEPAELPKVYPRYKHPSGIMLCSLWSEERNIVTP